MPYLSRLFVRSALMCLAVGFSIGGLILAAKGGVGDARVWAWLPSHIILLLFGWLVQLAIGVAYWILPRVWETDRGRPGWAWSSFWLMQAGIALTLITLLRLWIPWTRSLLAPGVLAQTLSVLAFAVHIWPRIKPVVVRAWMQQNSPEGGAK